MRILVWIGKMVVSSGFIWAGCMKLFQSAEKLGEMWPWTIDSPKLVVFTGMADLVVGLALLIPFRPKLTIYASYAAIAQMIAAATFHILRGEARLIGINVFFGLLLVFVIWGESRKKGEH